MEGGSRGGRPSLQEGTGDEKREVTHCYYSPVALQLTMKGRRHVSTPLSVKRRWCRGVVVGGGDGNESSAAPTIAPERV
jgi:hypothetical protein